MRTAEVQLQRLTSVLAAQCESKYTMYWLEMLGGFAKVVKWYSRGGRSLVKNHIKGGCSSNNEGVGSGNRKEREIVLWGLIEICSGWRRFW